MEAMQGKLSDREAEITAANTRLRLVLDAIEIVTQEAFRTAGIDESIILRIENVAGRTIRTLVRDHVHTYMDETVRSMMSPIVAGPNAVLDADTGELYADIYARDREEPLPEREWYRNLGGLTANITSLKFY